MDMWAAELYDYDYCAPFLVGIYSTAENAERGIKIIMDKLKNNGKQEFQEGRFIPSVTLVKADCFTPAIIDLLADEAFFA